MSALNTERNTPFRAGERFSDAVLGGSQIWAGSLVVLDASGYAQPATAEAGLVVRGVALHSVDARDEADGALQIETGTGICRLAAAETIDRSHIGEVAYAEDDQSVGLTATERTVVGPIVDVDVEGVWVRVGI